MPGTCVAESSLLTSIHENDTQRYQRQRHSQSIADVPGPKDIDMRPPGDFEIDFLDQCHGNTSVNTLET